MMNLQVSQRIRFVLVFLVACAVASSVVWAQQAGSRSRTSRSSTTGSYPGSTEVGEAMISSDTETRKLIVVTDDETAKQIAQVVKDLDRPAPQVLINVVFLEATYRKGLDVGVEGDYTAQRGSTTASLLQQFGAVPGLTSGEGLFNLASTDYNVTLRAIAENAKLEVLSRPSILARNNQQATITVGQRVPLITDVRYDNFGNQLSGIEYRDVGIILRVTPFITSDGMVEMMVAPEISNLSGDTVAISVSTNSAVGAPIINQRSADTVVVTPSGQTVAIGGLIANSKTENITKVPLLGDIPALGALFRRKVQGNTKTELMIFLTPHIVKHPSELAGLTQRERARSESTQKAFPEQELNKFFEQLPTREPEPAPPPKK